METFHFDLVLKSWRVSLNVPHNTHVLKRTSVLIHQSSTVSGSSCLTQGLQYTYIDSAGVDFDEDDDPLHKQSTALYGIKTVRAPFACVSKKYSSHMQSLTTYFCTMLLETLKAVST